MQDVNAPAQAWRFVDASQAAPIASLAHMQQHEPHRLYLPADAALTGFELEMPHLCRDDGRAVMLPAGLRSGLHRGEDYDPGAFFLYADEDIFFCVRGSAFGGWRELRSNWRFELGGPFRIGLRHPDRFDASQLDGIPAVYFWRKKTPGNPINSGRTPAGRFRPPPLLSGSLPRSSTAGLRGQARPNGSSMIPSICRNLASAPRCRLWRGAASTLDESHRSGSRALMSAAASTPAWPRPRGWRAIPPTSAECPAAAP